MGMAVVSVEYRLAPETPHPGPLEDCYAGLVWGSADAHELNIDPERIVTGGTTAGGGLAAGATLVARDRGGPAILAQLLLSPMLDDCNDSPSAQQMRGVGIWDGSSNETGWNALLGDGFRGGPDVSPYAAPSRGRPFWSAVHLHRRRLGRNVPGRGRRLCKRMWQAGGRVELHVWPGGFHGFDVVVPHAVISQDAIAARVAWLRRQLDE